MLKLTSVATEEDLQRKLAARIEAMKKEASELLKIADQITKKIRELLISAEKQHREFTNSRDPSDQDFLKVALNMDKTENLLVLVLSKLSEGSATIADARYSADEDDEVIQVDLLDSQKIPMNHLDVKFWSSFKYLQEEEKELSKMEEEISRILTEVSQISESIKTFTGSRRDQFSTYSDKSQQLFGVEIKLESISFKLVGVSSTLEKYQLEEGRKEEAKRVEAGEEEEEVCSVPGEEEEEEEEKILSSRPEDPNTEVNPRQLESPVLVPTITPVPVPVPSPSQSGQLRKVTELQIENIKKDLGVYSSFSLPLGSYQALNVFYVDGTPSKFWLSIDNGVLTEFNSLIKVFSCVFFPFFPRQLIYCSLEVTDVSE